MDWGRLLQMGAEYIRSNSDDATTNLDPNAIMNALGNVFGGSDGGLDLSSLVAKAQSSGLMEVVSSWIGSGENAPIDPENITSLIPSEKIQEFAQQLGISEDSAKLALAEALPKVVDEATNQEPSLAKQLLDQVGGIEGAMNMLKKLF